MGIPRWNALCRAKESASMAQHIAAAQAHYPRILSGAEGHSS
ncbi:MAG: hypothetical protein ACTS5Y_06605 [Pollutimonas bauzanensis]|nr:hypothetical protein [Pollutimonas bauzanensis]